MSTKPKRKAKPRVPRKPKAKPARKRAVPSKKPEKKVSELPPEKTFTLVIRLQGPVAVPRYMESTLRSFRLDRRFSAVLLEKSENLIGMLRQAKDYVTWGDAKTEDIAELLKERGELIGGHHVTDEFVKESFGEESVDRLAAAITRGQIDLKTLWQKGVKRVFRLHPPSGGFQGSIKRPFGSRGELGYRGLDISNLVARMM